MALNENNIVKKRFQWLKMQRGYLLGSPSVEMGGQVH